MSVDVFGRTLVRAKEVHKGPPGIGFILTKEGDFDIKKRRLCNVASALEPFDAVNLENLKSIKVNLKSTEESLKFLEENFKILEEKIKKLAEGLFHVEKELATIIEELRILMKTKKINSR